MAEVRATSLQVAEEDEDNESFMDAKEELSLEESTEEELEGWIEDVQDSFFQYLNNHFEEAEKTLDKLVEKSMYHALGRACLCTFQAVMTFQCTDIEQGLKTLKTCSQVCERHRRRSTFMQSLKNKNLHYSHLSPTQVHAELCYAECLLQQAFLTFIQDENFSSFIKGALKVKTCLSTYKTSLEIMRKREWKEGKEKMHFQSGICLGVGAFNLMVSLLPPKILKVLEFVGFKASKAKGLEELEKGAAMVESLRGPVCSILLIMYHTFIDYIFGLGDGNLELSNRLLQQLLHRCPQSAIFIFLHGRLLEVSGQLDEAICRLEESIASQSHWKQFHHFCYWELMWCHAYQGNWLFAMKYAEVLFKESKWSRSVCAYQAGAFMLMLLHEQPHEGDHRKKMIAHVQAMFNEVPRWKQRIAGKSLPVEKWCVRKVDIFLENNDAIVLPAYELFFIWNGFEVLCKVPGKLSEMLAVINQHINTHSSIPDTTPHHHDKWCLLHLLKGICLRLTSRASEAFEAFQVVLDNEKKIQRETHLVPSCLYELGLTALQQGDKTQAVKYLETARNDHTGYPLESRTCSKIQAALNKAKNSDDHNDLLDPANHPPNLPTQEE